MGHSEDFTLRAGTSADAALIARMFRQMWLDVGIESQHIVENADERVMQFLEQGERAQQLRSFIALRSDEEVGCAVCQLFSGLYPDVLNPQLRRYGYIWGVYVTAAARRAGIGEALTARCNDSLREIGCTHALLHAAPMGMGVYERLGFKKTNEMRLELSL